MSSPIDTPLPALNKSHSSSLGTSPLRSPLGSPGRMFHIPSPIITKRTRTFSASERAANNPTETGKVKYFCREKGHGFITPDTGGPDIFVHISDIDGEYVPLQGDEVAFKLCPIPPKNERFQAIHVQIVQLCPVKHERWDTTSRLMPHQ